MCRAPVNLRSMLAQLFFDKFYQMHEFDWLIVAEIKYLISGRRQAFYSSLGYVIYVGEIPFLSTVTKNSNGKAHIYILYEPEVAHVWSSRGSVNSKKSGHNSIDAIEIVITVTKHLCTLFASCIRCKRMVGDVRNLKRHLNVVSVNTRCGSKHKFFNIIIFTTFKEVKGAIQICINV